MSIGSSQSYLISSIAEQRRTDIARSAEKDRLLREAGVPTGIDTIRLIVGRSIVQVGKLVAGRRNWSRDTAPATSAALNLAR